ncbi:23S rRNA (adenine(2503)-C(2))-methyltransferase RlmN [Desulforhopalus sp. 52FAK]
MSKKIDLKNYTEEALVEYIEGIGQSRFRAKQIMGWLYRYGINSFDQMTDLAKVFRSHLHEHAYISSFSDPIIEKASDGCVKFGFRLFDGHILESVLIPEPERNTLCISSQVGCAMGCTFCLTGTMGFVRNLSVAEIVNQVCAVRDYLLDQPEDELLGPKLVTNVVYMGMGEPLNNLKNVLDSLSVLTHNKGLDIAARKITVSTCGIVPKLRELGENTNVNLAISLHAISDKVRSSIMPVNNRYNIDELLQACKDYPMRKRKRIMFEYTLLKGINDSDMDARMLVRKLKDIPCKINLLSYNECPDLPYKRADKKRILAFQKILLDAHYTVFIRSSRGDDISAACGQLATDAKTSS